MVVGLFLIGGECWWWWGGSSGVIVFFVGGGGLGFSFGFGDVLELVKPGIWNHI